MMLLVTSLKPTQSVKDTAVLLICWSGIMKQKTLFVGLLTRKKFHFIDKCTHKHEQKDLLCHALCILQQGSAASWHANLQEQVSTCPI